MKRISILLTALGIMVLANSCQKNVDMFVPDGVQSAPDTQWYTTITGNMPVISLKNDLRLAVPVDSFSYNNSGVIYNSGAMSLGIPASGLLRPGGVTPTGNLVRQSIVVQKKGDLIAMGMPTVSGNRLLISGGAVFLGLKNHNEDLSVAAGNSLTVKYNNNSPIPGMQVYNGTDDIINGYNWVPNTDVTYNNAGVTGSGYEVHTNTLLWMHTAFLFDTTGIPQTVFSVKLPSNYTNANTVVYISFNNMQCVAGMTGMPLTKNFISGDLPVNQAIKIIVISKQSGDYYFASQQTVTSPSSTGTGAQEVQITPVKTSLAEIKSYLSNL